jgi:hypothetical protein
VSLDGGCILSAESCKFYMGPKIPVGDAVDMIIGHEPRLKISHFHYSFDFECAVAPFHILACIFVKLRSK